MNYEEKNKIYQGAKRIVASDLSWSEKYDMIFSKEVSRNFSFDWCDPDMDYEDDVYAYMQGFDKYMDREKIIHLQIDNIWK